MKDYLKFFDTVFELISIFFQFFTWKNFCFEQVEIIFQLLFVLLLQ